MDRPCQRQHGLQMIKNMVGRERRYGEFTQLNHSISYRKPGLRGTAELLQAFRYLGSRGEHLEFHRMIGPGIEPSVQLRAAGAHQHASRSEERRVGKECR